MLQRTTCSWATFVPDRVKSYDLPLGGTARTIFLYGSKRRNKDETTVTFTAQDEGSAAGDQAIGKNELIQAIGMVEGPAYCKGVERHADKSRIPEHLRMIRFSLDKAAWQSQNLDALGDTLCGFEHRFFKAQRRPRTNHR